MRCALLSPAGVYLRMDEVDEPTENHLPQITECDLPPGKYKWVPDETNTYGGAFWEMRWLARIEQDKLDIVRAAQAAETLAARRAQRKLDREAEEAARLSQGIGT